MRSARRAPSRGVDRPYIEPPREVMARFGLKGRAAVVISAKPDKAVWRLMTAKGPAYLKRMPRRPSRVLFAVGAAEHLHTRGVGTPLPLRTVDGELAAMAGPAQYVLLSGVDGELPTYARDLQAIAEALGRFHLGSAGYVPPTGSRRRDHSDGWSEDCRRGLGVLRGGVATGRRLSRPGGRFLKEAATVRSWALAALEHLEEVLGPAIDEARQMPLLCHQDFAASNLRIAGGVVRAFDVDGVAFDLPVRDLRKLVTKVAKAEGRWRAEMVLGVVRAYEGVRPLSRLERAVLMADLEFPHLVVGAVKKFYLKASPEWGLEETARRLDATVDLEGDKRAALAEIAAEWGRIG